MRAEDLYVELNFSKSQIEALAKIYYKYFSNEMTEYYEGRGVAALWKEGATWERGKGKDANHNHHGIVSSECRHDPLWDAFSDILPYMSQSATITKMPPGECMRPHVDRKSRPHAIYFPISGCTNECVSEYYDLPKMDTPNSQSITVFPTPLYVYAVAEKAVLTNVYEWHGVKNFSPYERIAFGWNMKIEYSFSECRRILTDLGYVS